MTQATSNAIATPRGPPGIHQVDQGDERHNSLPFQFIRTSDDRGFGDGVVTDKSALHFHGSNPVRGENPIGR